MTSAVDTKSFLLSDESINKFGFPEPVTDSASGNMKLVDLPVFRSGTFTDAMGDEHTYDPFTINGFVQNFDYLKESKIFADVPSRVGHRRSPIFSDTDPLQTLVGYVTALKAEWRKSPIENDDNEYLYLLADVDIIAEYAKENINSKLWRNRSAEVGAFMGNDGMVYSPAFLGFAWVDMPAVQGLNFSQESKNAIPMEDKTMTGVPTPPVPTPAEPFKFSVGGNEVIDPARVQAYITDIEGKFAAASAQVTAVTAERDALKDFKDTAIKDTRKNFVGSLVTANKILAADEEKQIAFVDTLTDEQYSAWASTWGTVPENTIFQTHETGTPPVTPPGGEQVSFTQKDLDEDTIRSLKRIGKSDDAIKQSTAFARLSNGDANFSIASVLK